MKKNRAYYKLKANESATKWYGKRTNGNNVDWIAHFKSVLRAYVRQRLN